MLGHDRPVTIKVELVHPDAKAPTYANEHAVGMDVYAHIPNGELMLYAGRILKVSAGIKVQIPDGYELQVRPRSGMALKYGVTVLNSPGTIDPDYREEIGIILHNTNPPGVVKIVDDKIVSNNVIIKHGDRIAQLVLAERILGHVEVVDKIDPTERGGFGSTGQ